MFKYISLIVLLTLFQGQSEAAPNQLNVPSQFNGGIEQFIIEFIENHAEELGEIKQIIEEFIEHEMQHRAVSKQLNDMKNEMTLASERGDVCAKQVLLNLVKDKPICPTPDDLVQAAGKIVTATTDIITNSVHSFYMIFYSQEYCPGDMSGFRCFLSRFHKAQGAVFNVLDNITHYSSNIKDLINVYKLYFGDCKVKKQVHLQTNLQLYNSCNNNSLDKQFYTKDLNNKL
ncbi:hypothetical protein O3M35_006096 [Rhynocoris fuscipes]|uniref:Uncharacterized protein n=1 Tax=Rhynocoris fuscipes TaxID=488301 RepID=A0AAW1DHC0_9HEMI